MRFLYLLLLCFFSFGLHAQSYTYWLTGDGEDVSTSPTSGVVLAGGGGDNDNAMQWMLQRADGGDVVVLRASGEDGYNSYFFSELGVSVNSVETIRFDGPEAATDDFVLQTIQNAEVLFLAGGDQFDYYTYWKDTPVEDAINYLINEKGITIGGTSAGMAILGSAYYAPSSLGVVTSEALSDPFHPYMDIIGQGDFIEQTYLSKVITDTHYDQRNRNGRHVAFLARLTAANNEQYFGIACNEYTAVCINETGQAIVFGDYPSYNDVAYFLQTNCQTEIGPEVIEAGNSLHWVRGESAIKVYKVGGTSSGVQALNMNDWSNANGGVWENWYVNNGQLVQITDTNGDCADVLTNTTILETQASLKLLENLVRDQLILRNPSNLTIEELQIFNSHGQLLWQGNGQNEIAVGWLPNGMYHLAIKLKSGIYRRSFVKY